MTIRQLLVAGGKSKAVYVGAASALGSSISSMPTHQAGDLLVFMALAYGGASISLPAGKTSSFNESNCRVGYLVATGASEVSGTWTNAEALVCEVWRGANVVSPIGAVATGGGDNVSSVTYPALTLNDSSGYSFCARAAYAEMVSSASAPSLAAPTGYTNATTTNGSETPNMAVAGHYSTNAVTSVSSQAVSGGGFFLGFKAVSVEILGRAF